MKLGILFTALLGAAALPLQAGMLFSVDAMQATPINAGTYSGGIPLYITVAGTVNLLGAQIATNPDGSLVTLVAPASPFDYTYFLPLNPYPIVNGNGDGINHFPGGGANFDKFPTFGPWAPEGKQTTDTTDVDALRFGALVGTFTTNPTAIEMDPAGAHWFLVGYGGTFITPVGGGTLLLVVPDTNNSNNSGAFSVTVDLVPEPAAIWLAFSGILVVGLPRTFCRLSRKAITAETLRSRAGN